MDGEVEGPRIDLVTVDGGASGCRLAAFDERDRRVAEIAIDAPASLTLGEAEAWLTIRAGIARLAGALANRPADAVPGFGADTAIAADPGTDASGEDVVPARPDTVSTWLPATLGLGLAGALQGERRARFLERVERETGGTVRCRLVTDGHAQLVGASRGRPGVCLAVGTGSVAHWVDRRGSHGMAGGWGFPVGDEGSGAWLGARLLARYLWHRDGCPSASPLMAALDERLGASVSDVQRATTDPRSTTHARLARLVVEAADAGDALALSLLDEGAERCARLVERAPSELPLHVVGGLAGAYSTRFAARFGDRLSPPLGDALDGLRLIARGEAS